MGGSRLDNGPVALLSLPSAADDPLEPGITPGLVFGDDILVRIAFQHFLTVILLCIALTAHAQAGRVSSDSPQAAACLSQAAKAYRIPELALWLILDVEGGTLGRVSQNTNGTYDMGPMQINSIWLKRLAPYGITEAAVRDNFCVNATVAAWIFTMELNEHGTLPKAFANYHSPTPKHQRRYLGLIQRALARRMDKLRREQQLATR